MKEQELFSWLKDNLFADLEKSPDTYDGFDCQSTEHSLFIELKSRNTHYDTLLLEKKKFDFLVSKAYDLGLKAWYINSTPEGVWSFPLTDSDELVWEEKWLPVTTEFANKSKTMKTVTFLSLDKGYKIK